MPVTFEKAEIMKKLIPLIFALLLLAIFAGGHSVAAEKFKVEKPDMEKIREEVNNPKSPFYFKKLWKSFADNDTDMNNEQYRHLYLGYVFQEDYNPYRVSEFASKITPLYYKQKHTRSECDTIIKYAELSLADNPFDLNQMKFFIYALKEKQKYARASIWQYRLNHILEAILSTGTGKEDKPWVVISPAHEYNIVNFMGLIATEHQAANDSTDYILVDNKGKRKVPDGFYFDVSNVLKVYNTKFKE